MNKSFDEMEEDGSLSEFFNSKEFKDGVKKIIEEDTWDRGLPKIYLDNDGWIVKHWKDGRIDKIEKIK